MNVLIDYTNWRGERGMWCIKPIKIRFNSTKWHPEDQWLLTAIDLENENERDFAIKDIHSWKNLEE